MTLGPATRLVSLDAVRNELRIRRSETRKLLEDLGVPLVRIGDQDYLNMFTLEVALWLLLRPDALDLKPTVDAIREELHLVGATYAGLARRGVMERLSGITKPIRSRIFRPKRKRKKVPD